MIVVGSAGLPDVLFLINCPSKPLRSENCPTGSISTSPENAKLTLPLKASCRISLGNSSIPGET